MSVDRQKAGRAGGHPDGSGRKPVDPLGKFRGEASPIIDATTAPKPPKRGGGWLGRLFKNTSFSVDTDTDHYTGPLFTRRKFVVAATAATAAIAGPVLTNKSFTSKYYDSRPPAETAKQKTYADYPLTKVESPKAGPSEIKAELYLKDFFDRVSAAVKGVDMKGFKDFIEYIHKELNENYRKLSDREYNVLGYPFCILSAEIYFDPDRYRELGSLSNVFRYPTPGQQEEQKQTAARAFTDFLREISTDRSDKVVTTPDGVIFHQLGKQTVVYPSPAFKLNP